MSYTVALNPSGRSVLVRLHQDFDAATARAAAAAAVALGTTVPPGRLGGVVADVRGTRNRAGVGANYLLVWVELPAAGMTRRGRLGVVADPDDRSHDFVLEALSGAGYTAALFADPAAAVAWVEEAGATGRALRVDPEPARGVAPGTGGDQPDCG